MSERLNAIIENHIRKEPGARCLWWKGAWRSRSDFGGLADACTDTLRSAGFRKGQRLALLMPNSPMVPALALAAWRLGGILCPLNEKSGRTSLIRTLSLLDPFAVVVSEEVRRDGAGLLEELGRPIVVCSPEGPPPAFSAAPTRADSEDLAVIFSTSGTTGMPKAVPITHGNLIDNCRACMTGLDGLGPDSVLLNVLPNFHAFGFTVGTILPFFIDGAQAIVPGFMPPQNTLRAIREAPADVLLLVPTMLGFLTALLERSGQRLHGVRLLVTGGDRYNEHMDPRVREAFGVGVLEGYGITECSPVMAVNRNETVRRLGTVGTPLRGFEIQLRTESGTLAEGDEGILWVRGPSVTSGYYRAPELNRERFDDGWFNTGDYVRIEDGNIRILDRMTDIVIVGGFNVYPQEVEAILSAHPAVQTAVVVGTPNDISGEVPKAFVLRKPEAEVSEPELVRYCKERLAHYKVPRKVEFVESLPLSSTGKVLRRVLRERERTGEKHEGERRKISVQEATHDSKA
ncbi:AMP-binding protein [Fretibacterium sp. OH1220_COT-178]|uniref:AMP-binding protein n=1 Tax=Fretibacterium sp. OH1220_COT-178 TaxID=2491047 RepID=UPI000F5ECE20|nr:AMP-binding protein [Fretibacterium sp. OH1220_COT-178]RRD64459.1 AMP-dependent synthetase [Fretibacterium sp. OH1220_COT-178]